VHGSNPNNNAGWALTRLIRLHQGMREDLALLGRVSHALRRGDDGAAARMLAGLSMSATGWRVRAFCAAFCGFVHEHHATEDAIVFPMVLRQDPSLRAVVDKLMAEHRELAGYLDEVEGAFEALAGHGAAREAVRDAAPREAAVRAVEQLSVRLAAHLEFEERELAPALNAVSLVVSEDEVPPPPPEAFGVSTAILR